MTKGKAYLGTYLRSGGCVHFIKQLVRTEYERFSQDFFTVRSKGEELLCDHMQGGSRDRNLDMAWELYVEEKLKVAGFADKWERAYIELDEFELALGSMSVFHFGAKWSCFFSNEEGIIPLEWWHLRLHIYCGCKQVRPAEAFMPQSDADVDSVKVNSVTEEVSEATIDLHDPPTTSIWRGMLPALAKLPEVN